MILLGRSWRGRCHGSRPCSSNCEVRDVAEFLGLSLRFHEGVVRVFMEFDESFVSV